MGEILYWFLETDQELVYISKDSGSVLLSAKTKKQTFIINSTVHFYQPFTWGSQQLLFFPQKAAQ